jgi:ubiquinone/menaquinone biosynthesis C-methylase UbiE
MIPVPAESILACPTCKGPIAEDADGRFTCGAHGVVARRKFGFVDFLWNADVLLSAAGGTFDLKADEARAEQLQAALPHHSFRELQRQLADEVVSAPRGFLKSLAVRRFNRNYSRVEGDVALGAGQAILNKVNPHLRERGLAPLQGDIALEAGGGHGLHLPSFAAHFRNVVFLDCSFVHLMMGAKLAEENGVRDRIVYVRGDATALPFRKASIDFIHEAGVIEHVGNPDLLVAEALKALADRGTYVCLSPNRFPLSPEPHFRLPLFGLFPPFLRKVLIPITRGLDAEDGTDLLSLSQLRRTFRRAGEPDVPIYFLPRSLPETLRKTFIRRVIHSAFHLPMVGSVTSFILNRLLLPVMPYHIAVVSRQAPRA